MKQVVLVTALGTMASTTIAHQLRKSGMFYVIGADIYQKHMVAASLEVDEFHVFPPSIADLDGYIAFVANFCREHHVDFYFATIDEEIANLSYNRKVFEDIGVKLCIPNEKLVQICHYKNIFSQWMAENMPHATIRGFADAKDVSEFPVFIKPIEGRASIGCCKIESRAELEKFASGNCVIQEYVEGETITVDMVRSQATGECFQIQRRELLRNGNGCGIAVEIINNPQLSEICQNLMEKLELNGVVNGEFFLTPKGFKCIEINPRFSAGSGFSCLAGCDTVLNAVRIARGENPQCGEIRYGGHFTKRYETYQMD